MEPVWLFGAIALACGILLGVLINRLLNPSAGDIDQLKSDLERERDELKRYKANVNAHFNKTSDLVKELTQDYVKVYQHLAEGAQTLSDSPEFSQVLEQPQGRVLISVENGSRTASASKSAGPVAADAAVAAATVAEKDEPATAADTSAADNAWAPVESTRVAEADKTQAASTDAGSETVTGATEKAVADAAEACVSGKDETAAVKKARSDDSAEPAAVATDEAATGPAKTRSRSKPVA